MSAASLTPDHASSKQLVGNELILNGMRATGIASAFNKEVNVLDLITKGFLDLALQEINLLLKKLDPNGTLLQDLSVISLSLTDAFFGEEDVWHLNNWVIRDNIAYGVGGQSDNSLIFDKNIYARNGKYLLCIIVNALPSGHLELKKNGEWIKTIKEAGTSYVEIEINDITSDEISLVCVGVSTNENVEIFSYSIHYIADRFYEYMIQKVKSLATVDAEGFVPREEYEHTLDSFLEQFQEATKMYLKALTAHVTADNPHGITPEKILAAKVDHIHTQYLTKNQLGTAVEEQMSNYSKIGHTHAEYLERTAAEQVVVAILQQHISELISVDPLIITKAPIGVLPSRYAQTDISTPLQILLPTTIDHNGETSYDETYGIVTTNIEALMYEVPKVFSLDKTERAIIPSSIDLTKSVVNFRICYHTNRKVTGYRLRCKGGMPTEWSVYSGNTTFLHKVTNPQNYIDDQDDKICEIYFDNTEMVESLAFLFSNGMISDPDQWELKIEIFYDDFAMTDFGITDKGFQFCVPTKGTNRLIDVAPTLEPILIQPEICVDNIPLFIFGGREMGEEVPTFFTSYIPPEYGNIRKGINVFLDKFINTPKSPNTVHEEYIHPAFGTLTLKEGFSADDAAIKNIYNSDVVGWKSDNMTNRVVIEQTFTSDNVMLMGYLMNWRNEEVDSIPDAWTLTVEGKDQDGRELTVVYDSVEQYYPFYSVEDDDIVYHRHFDVQLNIKKLTLTMESRKTIPQLSLNKLFLYLSERFYSIPQNRMFLGLKDVSQMCVGSVIYQGDEKGWKPYNLCFGRSCVVPVNNMQVTKSFTEYTVPNPFFSTDVVAAVQNYSLQPDASMSPAAYITSVAVDKITVLSESPFRYAVSISRTW